MKKHIMNFVHRTIRSVFEEHDCDQKCYLPNVEFQLPECQHVEVNAAIVSKFTIMIYYSKYVYKKLVQKTHIGLSNIQLLQLL